MAPIVEDNPDCSDPKPVDPQEVFLQMKLDDRKRTLEQIKVIAESFKHITEDFVLESERKSLCIIVKKPEDAEKLLALKELNDGTSVSIAMHPHRNVIRRVVNVVGCCDMPDEEIQRELAPQGVIEVRRIKKTIEGGHKKDTEMVVLTYSPTVETYKTVKFGILKFKTFPYYTDLQQCFKCWEFRHIKPDCPQKEPICGICSGSHESMKGNVCCEKTFCKKCNSADHPISSRKCPKYERERKIHQIRIGKDVSYYEAKQEYETKKANDKDIIINYLNIKVTNMEAELEKKDREILILRAIYETMKLNEAKAVKPNQPQQPKRVERATKVISSKADPQVKKEPPKEKEAEKSAEEEQESTKTGEGKARRKKKGKKGRGK